MRNESEEYPARRLESSEDLHESISLVCFHKLHPGKILLLQRSQEAPSFPGYWSLPSKRIERRLRMRMTSLGDSIPSGDPMLDLEEGYNELILSLGLKPEQIEPAQDKPMPEELERFNVDVALAMLTEKDSFSDWWKFDTQDRGDHKTNMLNIPIVIISGDVSIKNSKKYCKAEWVDIKEAKKRLRKSAEAGSICSKNFLKSAAIYQQ